MDNKSIINKIDFKEISTIYNKLINDEIYKLDLNIIKQKDFDSYFYKYVVEVLDYEDEIKAKTNHDISIDFSRSDTVSPVIVISVERDRGLLTDIVNEIVRNCCRVLSLDTENHIIVKSELLEYGVGGSFELRDGNCFISLSTSNLNIALTTKEGLIDLINTIAHELYHARQALHFTDFYKRRMANYVHGTAEFEKYEAQLIEIGARAFAEAFVQYFLKQSNKRFKDLDGSDKYLALSREQYSKLPGNAEYLKKYALDLTQYLKSFEKQIIKK